MGNRRKIKDLARSVPGVGKILKEKEQLYQTNIRQKEQIERLQQKLYEKSHEKKDFIWPLLKNEILELEQKSPKKQRSLPKRTPPFDLNWVVPAVSSSSGGQADIFRAIKYLTQKGHDCRIYIFDPMERSSLKEQKEIIEKRYRGVGSKIFYNSKKIDDCDAIFATHWLTAYKVANFRGQGNKYYYAQGYEPHTQPMGYLSFLAEQTYSFGLKGIVLGEWLAETLSEEYGMRCDYFDFGYDPDEYFLVNSQPRTDILFYAQPNKAHRGFELGIMALELFKAKNPTYKIHLFGEDISRYKIPFSYVNHGIVSISELNDLYNRCAAGLSLSFTNISLIPLEMIASGCQPVVNDAYQNRMIKYRKLVSYAKPSPVAIADVLNSEAGRNKNGLKIKLPLSYSWDYSNEQIENILIKDLG